MSTSIIWKTESGSVRISPERGRILGIEVSGHQALWQPPAVDGGWNLGGERLWIGPEVDWFWQRVGKPDLAFYQVPTDLNPDHWTVTNRDANSCRSEIEVTLPCAHRDAHVRLGISRTFEAIPPSCLESRVGLAFQISTSLEILDGSEDQPVDLWSILQVPVGGHMLMPVCGVATPRDYFDPTPTTEVQNAPGTFRLRIGSDSMFKVGLSPDQSFGRMAYVRPAGDQWLVLTRSFPVHADLHYCDAPLTDLTSQGDTVQFFNDGGKFGHFGEMEHRSPALLCGIGPQTYTEAVVTRVELLSESAYRAWESGFLGNSSVSSPL